MANTIKWTKAHEEFARRQMYSLSPEQLAFMTEEQIKEHIRKFHEEFSTSNKEKE